MARSNMYYYKFSCLLICAFMCKVQVPACQGNCLLYAEGSGERTACELSYRALEYRQGSKESQLVFDDAIKIGPNYAWAYYEKSVPFFKRGLFAEGVALINKAIELEPAGYLYYRAYHYFYNRSYEYCARDLEQLYGTHNSSYTTTPGGELEMRLLLAMAYAHTGDVAQGIVWAEQLMDSYSDRPQLKGNYDHYCLGMLYYSNDQFDLAKAQMEKQLIVDSNLVDTYYYLGLIMEAKSKDTEAQSYFQQALELFQPGNGGYSANLFTEFNISRADVEDRLRRYVAGTPKS